VSEGIIDLIVLLHPPIEDCLRFNCPSDDHLLTGVSLLIGAFDKPHLP